MNNERDELKIFNNFKKFLRLCNYFSPSYFHYITIELNKKKYADIKERAKKCEKAKKKSEELSCIKEHISEVMKYFFYFIDLVIISIILFKNTIHILKTNMICDRILYIIITTAVMFFALHCRHKVSSCVKKEKLIKKIIEFNEYEKKGENFCKSIINKIKEIIVKISLGQTLLIGACIVIMGIITLLSKKNKANKIFEVLVAVAVIYYFIARSVHYWIVFSEDFKNKVSKRFVKSPEKKMRYIKLALFNYVKIILEFSILIYVFKYMGWAFEKININTFFELVYFIVSGKLETTTTIEMFINLLRIATLAMVITLNLGTYMSLEIKNIDNNMEA
ncbi:hypothetical protein [Clostridium botulinum]|uniref:hypothetical protein n=1 Tax=Clostridium botulinum TaxID=1491 RepID=UPI0013F0CEEE|nr:hypothetical protein [Clostridium botulinum]MCC5439935.1 hypothetical protein [Clostridium botulinum]NFD28524.1 hypothetical protein [Clostridium botulinum]NFD32379.1 hypothetical protein [Clostridium botulinum]NFD59187.1 hypothetical protein [Clostridium botulinum]NFE00943.1 hypothetical protein [Clostridium botulinum]